MNESTKELVLEYIPGKKLADSLDKLKNKIAIARQIGQSLAKLHDAHLVHGDLTTSNMILNDKKVYFIDFGLGYHSSRPEDYAVDLHVLKEALEARHPNSSKQVWKSIIAGYKHKKTKETLKRLKEVELRGRHKEHY